MDVRTNNVYMGMFLMCISVWLSCYQPLDLCKTFLDVELLNESSSEDTYKHFCFVFTTYR